MGRRSKGGLLAGLGSGRVNRKVCHYRMGGFYEMGDA